MPFAKLLSRSPIDPYLIAIVSMIGLATIVPAEGAATHVFSVITTVVIGLLFFLYGAKLSRENIVRGVTAWRLHLLIMASTFILFPLLAKGVQLAFPHALTPELYTGLIFLATLPSTVQSSIAFTSIARGNVSVAVCAASASSLLGIFVTPLMTEALLGAHGGISLDRVWDIVLQLLVPFLAGQMLRPWIGNWLTTHKPITSIVDRGSILLVVYAAFSEGVANGIWHQLSLDNLAVLLVMNAVLLAVVLCVTTFVSRRLGYSREDEISIVFCGSKKSLAAGLPMANVLFPAHSVGLIVLPLMLFHQIQLMVCATMARRYGARPDVAAPEPKNAIRA